MSLHDLLLGEDLLAVNYVSAAIHIGSKTGWKLNRRKTIFWLPVTKDISGLGSTSTANC